MNQISIAAGHLDWLLSRGRKEVIASALAIYNCATHIHLDTLDPNNWSHPENDRGREKLQRLADALANVALRVHLKARDAKKLDASLAAKLISHGRTAVNFARKCGVSVVAREESALSRPPDVAHVWAVIARVSADSNASPALPEEYIEDMAGGILDILSGTAHEATAKGGVGRTMKNTGAATIETAHQKHATPSIPPGLREHNRLAAQVLRKSQ